MNLLCWGGLAFWCAQILAENAQNSNSESHAEQTEDQDHIFQVHLHTRHTQNPTLFYKPFFEYSPESGLFQSK